MLGLLPGRSTTENYNMNYDENLTKYLMGIQPSFFVKVHKSFWKTSRVSRKLLKVMADYCFTKFGGLLNETRGV